MKIRNGFVSNSSSTSFSIYGVGLTSLTEAGKRYIGYDLAEHLTEKFDGRGLTVLSGQDAYTTYVGREWSSIRDDETAAQFKETIRKEIREILGENDAQRCETHEEAWYDG